MLCAMKASMRHHLVLGRRGENLAATYLFDQGLVILDRNWRCSMGEIDIVARDGDVVVMCEVKTRSSQRYCVPLVVSSQWLLVHSNEQLTTDN